MSGKKIREKWVAEIEPHIIQPAAVLTMLSQLHDHSK
jgi:hypothetical protein